MTAAEIYKTLGVSGEVLAYGEKILETLRPRFAEIDARAEINQAKVLAAMQKNRVNATHFAASTGYGYDDEGRDNLERVYADVFHTEAALVRPQITCGTHALTVALILPEHTGKIPDQRFQAGHQVLIVGKHLPDHFCIAHNARLNALGHPGAAAGGAAKFLDILGAKFAVYICRCVFESVDIHGYLLVKMKKPGN